MGRLSKTDYQMLTAVSDGATTTIQDRLQARTKT